MLVTFYFVVVCLVIFGEYLFNKLIRKSFGTQRSELEYYDIEPKIDPEMEIWKRVGHYATDHTTPIGFNTAREIWRVLLSHLMLHSCCIIAIL